LRDLHTHDKERQDKVKHFSSKSKKDFQIRTEEPGRRKTQKGKA
jgi:hypothetical protein